MTGSDVVLSLVSLIHTFIPLVKDRSPRYRPSAHVHTDKIL